MEENYEMDLLNDEQLSQDLEEFADSNPADIEVGVDNRRERRIDVLSSAIREKEEEFADYKDLLLKQRAVIELFKDENEKLKKNLSVQSKQSYDTAKAASERIIKPLRAVTGRQRKIIRSLKASYEKMTLKNHMSKSALKKQEETTDRMIKNIDKGNHILNRQREVIEKQEKIINALERENKTLRDAEWIRMENLQLKRTVSKSSQTDRGIDLTDDVIEKMTEGPAELAEMSHKIFTLRRSQELWDIKSLFTDILDLEPQCTDEKFLNYLVNEKDFQINTYLLTEKTDYSISYLGVDYQTIDSQITDNEAEFLRHNISITV